MLTLWSKREDYKDLVARQCLGSNINYRRTVSCSRGSLPSCTNFAKYPLHSVKYMDYLDLCKASKIIDSKAHLTEEGLKQIDLRRSGMDRGRFPTINKNPGLVL